MEKTIASNTPTDNTAGADETKKNKFAEIRKKISESISEENAPLKEDTKVIGCFLRTEGLADSDDDQSFCI